MANAEPSQNHLFRPGVPVGLDELVAVMREAARQPPDPVFGDGLAGVSVEVLRGEIDRTSPLTESINRITLKSRGWKGRVESATKRLLKWLVHWNTRDQAELNRSLVQSLKLVTHGLRVSKYNFSLIDAILRKQAEDMGRTRVALEEIRKRFELDNRRERTDEALNVSLQESGNLAREIATLKIKLAVLERAIESLSGREGSPDQDSAPAPKAGAERSA